MERSLSFWRSLTARLRWARREHDQAPEYSGRPANCQPGRPPRVDNWLRRIVEHRCRLCRRRGHDGLDLCVDCLQDLPLIGAACARCALPTALPVATCGRCMKKPPKWDAAAAPMRYDYPYDWLVRRLKFSADLSMAPLLARLMWEYRPPGWDAGEVLVPVPLHRKRLAERGYDQAGELARELGRLAGLPVLSRSLRRRRQTSPQIGLSAKARRKNLKDAFEIGPGRPLPPRVCLVDDVMTTGSTLEACTRVLLDSGVASARVWCAARADLSG